MLTRSFRHLGSASKHLLDPTNVVTSPVCSDRRVVAEVQTARALGESGCYEAASIRVRFPLVLRGIQFRHINVRSVARA